MPAARASGTPGVSGTGQTAIFSGSGSQTISLSQASPNLSALVFSGLNYTLSDGTLTLALSGTDHPSISVSDTTSQAISSTIAGTQGLLKSGEGTLVLSGSNTFEGGLFVESGQLVVLSTSGASA